MKHRFIIPVATTLLMGCTGSEAPAPQAESQSTPKTSAEAPATSIGGSLKTLKLDDIFPKDRVLEVDITLADKDWDTLRYQSRNFFEALQPKRQFEEVDSPYTYVEAVVKIDGVVFPRVGLRKKGFIGSMDRARPKTLSSPWNLRAVLRLRRAKRSVLSVSVVHRT